jgi:Skp family chaperone for outer membrane proteins
MKKLLIVLLAVAVVAPAYALLSSMQLTPPVVATVSLERVFNEIDALDKAQKEVEAAILPYQQSADELRLTAERLREDLDLFVPGTDRYLAAEAKWTQAVVNYQAMRAFIEAKGDALRAEARAKIYKSITDSARAFAENNGIDVVMTNDSSIPLQEGNDMQIIQQLALRRVVYANPGLDVTDQLIAWINIP